MVMQFAQLPMAAYEVAESVDRNRYKLRPETAKGAVADLCVMASRAEGGCISYNPRYWGIRWEWNTNEVSRLLKRLVDEGVFTVKKNASGSRSLIIKKSNVSRTATIRQPESNQQTGEESGQSGKVVSIKNAECKQDVTELLDLQLKEKNILFSETLTAASKGRKKQLTGNLAACFLELYTAYGDKRGRAEAAWAFTEIPGLCQELLTTRIIPAARDYAAKRPALEAKGLTPKMLQFWITAMRWEDFDPATAPANQGSNAAEETRRKYLQQDQA